MFVIFLYENVKVECFLGVKSLPAALYTDYCREIFVRLKDVIRQEMYMKAEDIF